MYALPLVAQRFLVLDSVRWCPLCHKEADVLDPASGERKATDGHEARTKRGRQWPYPKCLGAAAGDAGENAEDLEGVRRKNHAEAKRVGNEKKKLKRLRSRLLAQVGRSVLRVGVGKK